ncbi:unnamed protein product [marine sediment metagenome]|uniref:Uncharacterized protein n=1 Tax=marine sediment metagenome TaxID=412755 RepID=X0USF3_9ZZZZ
MASEVTLTTLRASVLDRADMTGGTFIVAAQLDEYINEEAAKLYYLLANLFEDLFYATEDITLVAGTESYDLPQTAGSTVKLHKSLKVYYLEGGKRRTLRRFVMDDLDKEEYLYGPALATGIHMRYRIMGNKIFFTPTPAAGTVEMWYIPEFVKLVNAGDKLSGSFQVVAGWEQYLIYGAAAQCLLKEESLEQAQGYQAKQAKLEADYRIEASERDVAEPQRITDVYGYGSGVTYGFGGW